MEGMSCMEAGRLSRCLSDCLFMAEKSRFIRGRAGRMEAGWSQAARLFLTHHLLISLA